MRLIFEPFYRLGTYRGLVYLMIALPLGAVYFALVVIGLSVGLGTLLVGVGVLVLAGAIASWRGASLLDCRLAESLLGVRSEPLPSPFPRSNDRWSAVRKIATDPFTWRSFAWLLLRLPLGILSFAVILTFMITALAGLLSPVSVMAGDQIQVLSDAALTHPLDAWPLVAVGAVAALLTPRVIDGLVWLHRQLLTKLLTTNC